MAFRAQDDSPFFWGGLLTGAAIPNHLWNAAIVPALKTIKKARIPSATRKKVSITGQSSHMRARSLSSIHPPIVMTPRPTAHDRVQCIFGRGNKHQSYSFSPGAFMSSASFSTTLVGLRRPHTSGIRIDLVIPELLVSRNLFSLADTLPQRMTFNQLK